MTAIDLSAALAESIARVQAINPPTPPRAVKPCLCGDDMPAARETPTRADLRGLDVDVTRAAGIRECRTCRHAIHVGQMHIGHTPIRPSSHRDYYHPACAEI